MKYIIFTSLIIYIFFTGFALAQNEIPDSIKDKILNGIQYLEKSKVPDDLDKAVKEFTEAIAIAPEYSDVHYFLGKTLSLMQGNAGKAVNELKKYLEMYPDAPDKDKVNKEISRLQEIIKAKRKSSMKGAEFVSTSDGIYVSYIYPFSPANKELKIGDKIISIGKKDITAETGLHNFLKLIDEYPTDKIPAEIVRADNDLDIVMNKSPKTLDKNIVELGEEDLNDIISSSKPVVAVFWTLWCAPCRKLAPYLQELAAQYGSSITFVSVSIDENKSIGKEFEVVNIPDTHFYKNGKLIDKIVGYDSKLLVKKVKVLIE